MPCRLDAPDVGKHLKDHLQVGLVFPAPGVGVSMSRDRPVDGPRRPARARRAAAGRPGRRRAICPTSSRRSRPKPSAASTEWATTGHGLVSSSLYEACAWFSTGLGDHHTHDAQIGFFVCGYNPDIWRGCLRVDPDEYFDDPSQRLGPDAESDASCSPTRCSPTARARSCSPAPTRSTIPTSA